MFDKILTLCTGNICCSLFVEVLLRQRLADRGRAVTVASAGTGALVGHPADADTQAVALARGLDLSTHRARQLTPEITRWADIILVMEKHHLEYATRLDPSARGKIFLLGHWDKAEVPDPYRLAEENHQLAYDIIAHTVDQWIGKL